MINENTNKAEFKSFVRTKSVTSMISCPLVLHYLSIFMEQEMASENLTAILDIRTLDSIAQNEKELSHKVEEIYNNYIRVGAPAEVNIDFQMRISTEQARGVGLKEFVKALKEVEKTLLDNIETDTAPRFLVSPHADQMYLYLKNKNIITERKKLLTANDGGIILNNMKQWNRPERPPNVVIQELLANLLNLIKIVLPRIPKPTDTETMEQANSELFAYLRRTIEYCMFEWQISELQKINLTKLTCYKEKLSFFLNLYHVMMLHYAIINGGIINCNFQSAIILRKNRYNIGGLIFSIDDVINGVLRGNKSHPVFGRRFKDDDLRALFVVNSKNNLDPRIHFSISRFCEGIPDIKLVTPETVEMVLQQQTQQYLNSQVEFIGKQIMLPSIIQENRSDFGNKTRDLLVFLEKFLVNENRTKLLSNAATVNFKKMDSRTCLWDLCWDSIFEYSPSFNKTEISSCANTNNEVN